MLWVDDHPKNNIEEIKTIYGDLDVEILQVTGTREALKWIQEFGWLLKWRGLELKLISDMRREEMIGEEMRENDRAGIDLLVELYQNHGYTAKTLIFCGNL